MKSTFSLIKSLFAKSAVRALPALAVAALLWNTSGHCTHVSVQFGGDSSLSISSSGDYWNYGDINGGDSGIYLTSLLDSDQNPTSANISCTADQTWAGTQYPLNGFAGTGGGNDFQIVIDVPASSCSITVYGGYLSYYSTFSIDGIGSQTIVGNATFNGVTPDANGQVTINVSSGTEPLCSGVTIDW